MPTAKPTPVGGGSSIRAQLLDAVAQQGRGGDTQLAHVSRKSAKKLKDMGGSGTTNPDTGLPEFQPAPPGVSAPPNMAPGMPPAGVSAPPNYMAPPLTPPPNMAPGTYPPTPAPNNMAPGAPGMPSGPPGMPPGPPPGTLGPPMNPVQQALADAGRRRLIMEALAGQGRHGDTMLAHVNPREMLALKLLAGGAGTPNPDTGLPQFYPVPWGSSSSDPSRGSDFTGVDASGNPLPDPTQTEPPDWGERMLAKLKQHPGMIGGLLGGLGGSALGPMGGALGGILGAGAGLGGEALGLWGKGSGGAASGTPSSYTAGGIPAYNIGNTPPGGNSGFTLAKLGLLGNLF